MYDRKIGERELNFEASGALEKASLVMRDRETDSWWSMMSARAIGGSLDGQPLAEMPIGEKLPWGEWQRRHPDSLVLSVNGEEHAENNPYDSYFGGEGTFRDVEVSDDRLKPKAPIYSFRSANKEFAVPHASIEGGALLRHDSMPGRRLLFHRPVGASIHRSTVAFSIPALAAESGEAAELALRASTGQIEGAEPLGGFDTFWYTWVHVNPESEILGPQR